MAAPFNSSMNSSGQSSSLVCVGVITGVRGLNGEVRIKSFTEDPEDIASYGEVLDEAGQIAFKVQVVGHAKGQVIARLEGIAERSAAEALKGRMLYVPRQALPDPGEDEYYYADLAGLAAETVSGEKMGTVKAVRDYGAGVFLEIDGGAFGEVMVPFTRAAVPVVDMDNGRLVVDPPSGLLEEAEPEGEIKDGDVK